MHKQRLTIFSDGGARGNPGPAAIAFIALNENYEVIKEHSAFIGIRTNNQAEYEALTAALEFAKTIKPEEIVCSLDSELVVRQLTGEYAVKNADLKKLWSKIQESKKNFKQISFKNVPRENIYIQKADALVNETLDNQNSKAKITMFSHSSIRTSNLEKSIDFYTRLLGLKLLSRREIEATNAELAFLQDPQGKGSTLELTFYRNQKKFVQPEYEERLFDHLGFEVADMEKIIAVLRKEKVTITDEPFKINPQVTIAFIEDPDGTLIELVERK